MFFILNVTLAIVFDAFSSQQEKTGVPNPLADMKDPGDSGSNIGSNDKLGSNNSKTVAKTSTGNGGATVGSSAPVNATASLKEGAHKSDDSGAQEGRQDQVPQTNQSVSSLQLDERSLPYVVDEDGVATSEQVPALFENNLVLPQDDTSVTGLTSGPQTADEGTKTADEGTTTADEQGHSGSGGAATGTSDQKEKIQLKVDAPPDDLDDTKEDSTSSRPNSKQRRSNRGGLKPHPHQEVVASKTNTSSIGFNKIASNSNNSTTSGNSNSGNSRNNKSDTNVLNRRYTELCQRDQTFTGKIQKKIFEITDHESFQWVILFFIVANVITLSLDDFPAREKEIVDFLNLTNMIFFAVFCVEALLLHIAIGPRLYWTQAITAFDGFILLASILELIIANTKSSSDNTSTSAMTAFRALRVFKLAKNFTAFRLLLKSIYGTVMQIGNFMLLLALMIYIFALAGQNFYATYFLFHPVSGQFLSECTPHARFLKNREHCEHLCGSSSGAASASTTASADAISSNSNFDFENCQSRAHFDTFLWSCVTIFQVLTGENWNLVFYDAVKSRGPIGSILYFGVVVCVGNFVILNVFLAILMCSFERQNEQSRLQEEKSKESKQARRTQMWSRLSFVKNTTSGNSLPDFVFGNSENEQGGLVGGIAATNSYPGTSVGNNRRPRRSLSMAVLQEKKQEMFSRLSQKLNGKKASNDISGTNSPSNTNSSFQKASSGTNNNKSNLLAVPQSTSGHHSPNVLGELLEDCESSNLSPMSKSSLSTGLSSHTRNNRGSTHHAAKMFRRAASESWKTYRRYSNFFVRFLVNRKNKFVDWIQDLRQLRFQECVTLFLLHPIFEQTSMICILLSCALMTWQNPLADPESDDQVFLKNCSTFFTIVFTLECLLKGVGFGWISLPKKHLNRYVRGVNYYEEKKRRREEAEKLKKQLKLTGVSKTTLRAADKFKKKLVLHKKRAASSSNAASNKSKRGSALV